MPYKAEKINIVGTKFDRRVKLTPADKEEIRQNALGLSQRALARLYNVSRRTIQFIIFPEKLEENLKRRQELGGSKRYYNREKHTECIREHRKYKNELSKKGLI